jgi:hypothetical protein
MKTESNRTSIKNFDERSHFHADSALLEFLGLGLRAPGCSPDESKAKPIVIRVRRKRRLGRSRSAALQPAARIY